MKDSQDRGTQRATQPSQCDAKTAGRGSPNDTIATALQQSSQSDQPDTERSEKGERKGTYRYLQKHILFPRRFVTQLNPR